MTMKPQKTITLKGYRFTGLEIVGGMIATSEPNTFRFLGTQFSMCDATGQPTNELELDGQPMMLKTGGKFIVV